MAKSEKYGDIAIASVPPDEPVFIIRAGDPLAPYAVEYYGEMLLAFFANLQAKNNCQRIADRMRDWKRQNITKN